MGRKERMSPERKELIQQFLAQNDIKSAHDIEIALRDMMKETLKSIRYVIAYTLFIFSKYPFRSNYIHCFS